MSENTKEMAQMIAAQCWCESETAGIEMDVRLAEAFTRQLENWIEAAAQHHRNEEYYRGLVVRCGEAIGERAYIADDGSIMQDVLCAKVPEIIEADYNLDCHDATHWMPLPSPPSVEG